MRRWLPFSLTLLVTLFNIWLTTQYRPSQQRLHAEQNAPRIKTPPVVPDNNDVFDYQALISTPLNARVLRKTEKDGIVTEEVMFHAEKDGDKDIDIFAYFSYPAGAKTLPAFVWNQGGMKQATAERTQFGAKRGYATLCIDFPLPGYRSTGNYPIQLGPIVGKDPQQAPIYHGAVALLKAVSFLESRAEVDTERIGMAGSSWGGFFTTLMVGIDPRLKAGACMFGAGNLQMGNMWWDAYGRSDHFPPGARDYWRITLDPARRLTKTKTPIAWFTGTNDWFYWMPSIMKTHEMTGGPKHLTLVPNWDHALPPEIVEQTFAWLDVHLKGHKGFERVSSLRLVQRGAQQEAQWRFAGPREVKRAELILSYGDAGNWHTRYWKILPAQIKGDICSVTLPWSTQPYYISGAVTDTNGFRTSTPLLRLDPQENKTIHYGPVAPPNYDGAQEWGDFEPQQALYLQRHNIALEPTRETAHDGEYSVRLAPGRTDLPIMRYTAGAPHRLTCYLKSAKPTTVKLELQPDFNGLSSSTQQEFKIGKEWTKISLAFTPREALSARSHVALEIPDGARVWLDNLSLTPEWTHQQS